MVNDFPDPWVCQITPPFARAADIELLHGLYRTADAEKLLMTRYLSNAAIKNSETPY